MNNEIYQEGGEGMQTNRCQHASSVYGTPRFAADESVGVSNESKGMPLHWQAAPMLARSMDAPILRAIP